MARCGICNAYHRKQQHEPLLPHPVPERQWQNIRADIFTLYDLQVVDYFSKYPEICQLESKTASSVVVKIKYSLFLQAMDFQIDYYMYVTTIVPFSSGVIKTFSDEWTFTVTTTSLHYLQANGQSR